MSATTSCIYCGVSVDPTVGEGDHVIPAALGEFANGPRFRRLCLGCNNIIGRSEAQLLRCGPEALMLRLSSPAQRRGGRDNTWPGAMGAPPPAMTTERFGARFAVKLVSGEPFARELVDSLDVVGQDGAHHTIRVDPSMNAAAIKAQIARLRLKAPVTVHFNVSEGNSAWFDGIAAELWKESAILELPPMEPGPHSGKGMVSFNVNEHYFRAVAKMAFHYYLCAKPDAIHGSELAFTDIRRFIRYGEGEIEQFFTSPTRSPVYFGTPFGHVVGGGVVSSAKWCHLLMACEGSFGVVVHMQMFLGPHFANPPHYVVLSRDLAASKPRACAHVFLWEAGSGEKGWVQPKAVAATGRPESIAGPWLETTDAANALFVQVRS